MRLCRVLRAASATFLLGFAFLGSLMAHAAPGAPLGTTLTRIPGGNDEFARALVQSDGRMLLVGSALSGTMRFAITRFEIDGTLSASFGSNGTTLIAPGNGDAEAWAAALQPDGRILVAGGAVVDDRQRFAVARLNADGTLDTTFNGTGFATTAIGPGAATAYALALQPDGRIVAGGFSTAGSGRKAFTLARYNADGTLDTTFGSGGIATRAEAAGDEVIRSLGLQSDGRIVAAGSGTSYLAMGRFLPNGQHDLTWAAASHNRILGGQGLVVLPDDKVAIAGTVPDGAISMLGVLRMTREGNVDSTWGPGTACAPSCPGIAARAVHSSATARGIVRQPDGRIVVSGDTVTSSSGSATVIARFTSDGHIDLGFGIGGATVTGESNPVPTAGMRVEESHAAVTFAGAWTPSHSRWGWSGGSAMESTTAGAAVSIRFIGTSIRWIGSRGRGMGIALVSVDGGPPREVDLFARPTDEIHTPIFTVHDLSNGPHTLTIEVTGRKNNEAQSNVVVVDAFDVQPGTAVSHWQDTDPDLRFSAGWAKSSIAFPWSGSGVSNQPELPVTAQETQTAGASVTLPFRGTAIAWIGYRGPDAGIAQVQVDGGTVHEVDLYSPAAVYQPVVFTATGLADANHTLTIQATGRMNAASSAARVVVDAFDITTPGRRYEEYERSIEYKRPINADGTTGAAWTPHNDARVWSEGGSATNNAAGATATFRFTGTSVSWIGCRKGSCSGRAKVFIDDVFVREISLSETYPIEGYQKTVFRTDGLAPGAHALRIEVTSTNGGYVVVDAFDVHSDGATGGGASNPDAAFAADQRTGLGLAMRADGRFVVGGIVTSPALFGTGRTSDSAALAFTADGAIDPSFNGVGQHVRALDHLTAEAMASARQADGKVVVAGLLANRNRVPIGGESPGGLLARYLADGTLDTSFAGTGYIPFDWPASAVAIQPDGRIVIGGWKLTNQGGSFAPSIAVARYLPDGTIDGSFGSGGLAMPTPDAGGEQLHDIAIQPDGRIVGAGTKLSGFNLDAIFVRLTSAGGLDASFNGSGKRVASMHPDGDQVRALLLQPDGRIVGAGFGFNSGGAGVSTAFMATRLNADGSTDTGFASNGVATVAFEGTTARALAAALQADGGMVLAGAAGPSGASNFALARLNADGSLDTGFGSGGRVVGDFGGDEAINALAVLANGKIVAAGASSGDPVAAQYLGNGAPDTAFGSGGATIFPMAGLGADAANALTIGADRTLYVAGTGSGLLALARLAGEAPGPTAIATVSLGSSANPSAFGQAVTFTASVAGSSGPPTGTVAFQDNGVTIGGCASLALAGGAAACTASGFAAGAHPIVARYSGDAIYLPAGSSTFAQTVQSPAAATVTLVSSANPSTFGEAVTFTATVSGGSGTPTGTVTFQDNGATIAGCAALALAAGSAACTTSGLAAGSHPIVVRYSGNATYPAADSSALTQSVQSEPATTPSSVSNLSTRGAVGTGENALIGGLIIGGSAAKTVVIRARGPSLASAGVSNPMANPVLQLVRSSDQVTIATNDDWGNAPNAAAISASGFAPSSPAESAVMTTLPPGAYTAIVSGAGGGTGVAIVEVFEVDTPESPLVNISTRGQVLTAERVLIGGFVIQGDGARTVVVRARGPSLASAGIAGSLANPVLQLVRSSDQSTVAANDNWIAAANAAAISASGFAPSNDLEAAVLVTLPAGAYTAIVTGAGGGTGVGIVEVFAVP